MTNGNGRMTRLASSASVAVNLSVIVHLPVDPEYPTVEAEIETAAIARVHMLAALALYETDQWTVTKVTPTATRYVRVD